MPTLSVIIPCYFNEQNIPVTIRELTANETLFPPEVQFEYVFVDDGSKDNTFQELLKAKELYPDKVKVVKLAGNVGSYNAIIAGMEYATGDCSVIISADLQDPPELMVKMLSYWRQGFKLVIGSRQERDEPVLKKFLSRVFHSLMRKMAFQNLPKGGFDYVLFDRAVREEVLKLKEGNSNVMYLMAWLGYEYVNIPYSRGRRTVGTSKWTFWKKVKLFLDSVLAFSFYPIRAISVTGLVMGLIAFLYGVFVLLAKATGQVAVEGWTALMVVLLFVSSFQMIALGVIGEYVWRTLEASRKRPMYIVESVS
ncbi:glycosyl transferase family 2 [Rufibacter radiotolerans]|uniref:Glycosyl transferase family 2 n=1 Tax=Rufibacter radiotolerans TaxID=1379910 RepID=A0A0H4VGP4_9BACT|nr:glycosyltransferase family 2 protein [Rufibacter radiotolerans]AKQ44775.1 glycosyl transferase family 2 [Rufibacter radiotolerans]